MESKLEIKESMQSKQKPQKTAEEKTPDLKYVFKKV